MPEQRRIGYRWNFCALMAKRNLWKTTELMPLLRSRGINLSESQVYGWSRPRRNASRPGRSRRSATSWTARRTTCSNNSLRCVPRRQPTHSSAAKTSESNQLTPSPSASASSHPRTVSRPRKAEDPTRWPVPCNRCGQHHQTVARWPDGGVCGYCYQQAKRTRGICACGHAGVLPGLIDNQPACRRCSGIRLNVDCGTCGAGGRTSQRRTLLDLRPRQCRR